MKHRIFSIIIFFLSAIILILMLETASSYLVPKIDFSAIKDQIHFRDLEGEFQVSHIPNLFFIPDPAYYEFNSMGFNDREYPSAREPDTKRIIVVGDSVTQGEGVANNELYHEILERELNSDSSRYNYEVWNCGVSMYNTLQQYLYFKNFLLEYDPDMVIIGYLEENDYEPPRIAYNASLSIRENYYVAMVPKMLVPWQGIHDKLCLFNVYKLSNIIIYKLLGKLLPEKYPDIVFKNSSGYESMLLNRKALLDFKELCDAKGIKLLLAVFPILEDKPHLDTWLYNIEKKTSIETVYLRPVFKELIADIESLRIKPKDHLHPNARGHIIAADEIEKKLRDLGWIE